MGGMGFISYGIFNKREGLVLYSFSRKYWRLEDSLSSRWELILLRFIDRNDKRTVEELHLPIYRTLA